MEHPLTREQCRYIDRFAIEQLEIPSCVLMENAGRNTANVIERLLQQCKDPGQVRVLCGRGNNGGDGLVIARHLAIRGFQVAIDLIANPAKLNGDAELNYRIIRNLGIPVQIAQNPQAITQLSAQWSTCTVLVDALLGTGFAGQVREPLATAINLINQTAGPVVVAVDLPSGLDCDTGQPGGVAVHAAHTITFLARKPGFDHPTARNYTGEITVADIGAPIHIVPRS